MSTASTPPARLEADYTPAEVAQALRKSERWLRNRIRDEGIAHTRRGNKVTFTKAQVEALRELDAVTTVAAPITTGRAKKST